MIDKFKPKLPRLPYPFIPPFDPPSEQPPYIPPESSGGATMKDPQAKTRAHVHHGGPRIGPGRLHRMNLWLSKRRHHYPTSSGRGSRQIIPITCHQDITTPTICPKAIQDTIILACHRIQ